MGGERMKNKLIPIYREKELYTLFYDTENNELYKTQHRNKSYVVYVVLFLLVIYGSSFIDHFYSQVQNALLNVLMILFMFVLSYFIGLTVYRNYYLNDTARSTFFNQGHLEELAIKGTKQLRVELIGCCLAILLAIIGFGFFLLLHQIVFLMVGSIGIAVLWILVFMKPIKRIKVLKDLKNNKIDL